MDEKELLEKAKMGNKSALNTLLQLNYKILFGFVIKMTGDEILAEDITQDALLKSALNIKKFKENCKFSTWLIQISVNIYKDTIKKNKFLEFQEQIIPSHNNNPEDRALINLEYEAAIKELKELPYKQRTAFILKHYYGYSLEEISLIMDCPKGTVKSRISICLQALKKALEV